jgi:alpha-L-fucosidase
MSEYHDDDDDYLPKTKVKGRLRSTCIKVSDNDIDMSCTCCSDTIVIPKGQKTKQKRQEEPVSETVQEPRVRRAKLKKVSEPVPETGMIFHWGLYSVTAYDDPASVSRRRTGNGSDWYLKRLMDPGTYRPISGHAETKAYHAETFGDRTYFDLKQDFTPTDWDPQEWMDIAKGIGASYVILTSRHHDGFCLWDTATTDNKSEVDVLATFAKSAKENGLKFGIYYSWIEFGQGFTQAYIRSVTLPQIAELEKYKPDIWWFDGHWDIKTQVGISTVQGISKRFVKAGLEVNDRVGPVTDADVGKICSYRNYSDRYLPDESPGVRWEYIGTIGQSWGANKLATKYKTGRELLELRDKVHLMGGRFLINMGPLADGSLLPQEVKSLRELAGLS